MQFVVMTLKIYNFPLVFKCIIEDLLHSYVITINPQKLKVIIIINNIYGYKESKKG